ncbi:MAG: hypothetical protein RMJ67_06435 [Elusimicrobiota bacterium]|nr:hypothetical protein [Endomicrobiia bacterium]MDW8166131.1 hypothetical protein [Elusimicrobiota bacterium]
MNRVIFTKMVAELLNYMIKNNDFPVIDYCIRSAEEQKRLFDKGLSKCDGYKIKSKHQLGLAIDIYLADNKGNIQFNWNKDKAIFYHKYWEQLGGKKMIEWDLPHFEL